MVVADPAFCGQTGQVPATPSPRSGHAGGVEVSEDLVKIETCRTCSNPFPLFVETSTERLCHPCRKRAKGEPLTKSDLALEIVHTVWRSALDDAEAQVDRLRGDDDRERILARARNLEAENEQLRIDLARLRMFDRAEELELLRRRVQTLERTNGQIHQELASTRWALSDAKRTIEDLRRRVGDVLHGRAGLPPQVDRDFVTQVLKLVHPDRWSSMSPELGALATTVTARLLSIRKELKP